MIKKKYNWRPNPQPERNKRIFEKWKKGNYSYRTLGRIFHLSHTRIREIIQREK
jgi:Mor family transcriptional regulator